MKIKKTLGAGLISLGLVAGMSGFASALVNEDGILGEISTTGPDSVNIIKDKTSNEVEAENENEIEIGNMNKQFSKSNEAEAEENTTAGDAESGMAKNTNKLEAMVEITNTTPSIAGADDLAEGIGGTIDTTGPDSFNKVEYSTKTEIEVENENEIEIHNFNTQTAISGEATVEDNTTGGNATSGDAINENLVSMTFKITNN